MQNLKKFIFKLLQRFYLQPFYEFGTLFFLRAMNFGGGFEPFSSGEAEALNFAIKLLRQKSFSKAVIFDVGANKGDFSCMCEKLFNQNTLEYKIFAFEPVTKTFEILQDRFKNNQNIVVEKKALGSAEGNEKIYGVEGESGLASLYKRNLEFVKKSTQMEEVVQLVTLDNYCETKNVERIDYLKMDVEGHELAVLSGAKAMLEQKKIQCIQFEFGGANIDSKTYFKDFYYLLSPNYNIFRILTSGLYPIGSYKETYEIFLTSNYLAILK